MGMENKRTIPALKTVVAATAARAVPLRISDKSDANSFHFIEFTLDIKLSWVRSVQATDSRPYAKYRKIIFLFLH